MPIQGLETPTSNSKNEARGEEKMAVRVNPIRKKVLTEARAILVEDMKDGKRTSVSTEDIVETAFNLRYPDPQDRVDLDIERTRADLKEDCDALNLSLSVVSPKAEPNLKVPETDIKPWWIE